MSSSDVQQANLKKVVQSSIQYAIDRILELYDCNKIQDAEALSREFDVWFEEDYGDYYIMFMVVEE